LHGFDRFYQGFYFLSSLENGDACRRRRRRKATMKLAQFFRFLTNQSSLVTLGAQIGQHLTFSSTSFPKPKRSPFFRLRDAHPALDAAREDFVNALNDVDTRDACCLSMRISHAHSMQALWHLRSEVFLLISLCHNQVEAVTRLERLSQHFPTRSPRSAFGALID